MLLPLFKSLEGAPISGILDAGQSLALYLSLSWSGPSQPYTTAGKLAYLIVASPVCSLWLIRLCSCSSLCKCFLPHTSPFSKHFNLGVYDVLRETHELPEYTQSFYICAFFWRKGLSCHWILRRGPKPTPTPTPLPPKVKLIYWPFEGMLTHFMF